MYGSYFSLHKHGLTIILNGWWFSLFKNLNTKRWEFMFTQNLWRKMKQPKPI